MTDRKTTQDLFVRVCRDSRYKLPATTAAALVGRIMGTSALVVWLAMPSFDVMEEIAAGRHPVCQLT